MLGNYTEIILFIAGFELSFLGFIILIKKTQKPYFKILGLFILTKGLCIASSLINNYYPGLLVDIPFLYYTGVYLALAFGPLLFLFIRALTTEKGFTWRDSIHLAPLALVFFYFFVFYFFKPAEEQISMLITRGIFPSKMASYLYWGFYYVFSIAYMVNSWEYIRKYNIKIKECLSSVNHIKISWLYPVLIAFTLILVVDAANMYIPWVRKLLSNNLIPILETIFLIFAQLILYIGFTHPIFKDNSLESLDGERYSSSKLNLIEKRNIINTLRTRMQNDRLYLDPELTISKMSKATNIPSRDISQVINEVARQNFFDFVNTYRIEDAKQQLIIKDDFPKTILEILYSVGFNSKSVFNDIFKKKTGMTPTQYRNEETLKLKIG